MDVPGFTQRFQPNNHEQVEHDIELLRQIGVRKLRLGVSWAEYSDHDGAAWYGWLLTRLSRYFELLPCVYDTPPTLSQTGRPSGPPHDLNAFAHFIDHVLSRHGELFESVELWRRPTSPQAWDTRLDLDWTRFCTMITAAANVARQCGKCVVLGAPSPTDIAWLSLMGQRGLLGLVQAIGMHSRPEPAEPDRGDSGPGWEFALSQVKNSVHGFNPDLEIWITEGGHAASCDDPIGLVQAFVAALDAPCDRFYWYGLRDLPAEDELDAGVGLHRKHVGIQRADGQPTLLGRLLKDGVATVRKVADLNRKVAVLSQSRPVLITGGAGFIGAHLADRLARDGENVLIYDSLARAGVEDNVAWLRERHPRQIACAIADVRDKAGVQQAVRESAAVFHFAAQVAVTTSMANPLEDLQVNLQGTFNVLEALRDKRAPCIFSSTNKVYGGLDNVDLVCSGDAWQPSSKLVRQYGCDERQQLDFRTPYGCSKGAADQYALDYARSFDVPTAVMRMSCIYGPRQLGTEDQGWVAHFVLRALSGEPITIYGDGFQVRDILFVDDAVDAYVAAWRQIHRISGQAFNLGGGPHNAISLLQLVRYIRDLTGLPVPLKFAPWRPNDQRYYVSDTRKVRAMLELATPRDWHSGVATLIRSFTGMDSNSEPVTRMLA